MTKILVKLGYLAGATRFRRISEKLYIDGDAIYKNAGINFKASWFPIFYVLAKANSPLTVMEIVCQIDFSRITVKNVVRELEKSGLIVVNPNPTDKRSKKIALSVKGEALLKELKPLWLSFSKVLQNVFESGHPDIINILNRIDYEINYNPINLRIQDKDLALVTILDYKPSLKKYFYELASAKFGFSWEKLQKVQAFHFKGGQGAKTGTGGHLPASKVVGEIAKVRGLKVGHTAISPAAFPDIKTLDDFK